MRIIFLLLIWPCVSYADSATNPPTHRIFITGGYYALVTDSTGILGFSNAEYMDIVTADSRVNIRLFKEVPFLLPPEGIVELKSTVVDVTVETPAFNVMSEVVRLLNVAAGK